jgi:serine acetyltransferase
MGSVVGGDVPNLAVVAGNPARVIKYRNKEKYEYLDNQKKYYLLEKTNNTNFKHIYIRKS